MCGMRIGRYTTSTGFLFSQSKTSRKCRRTFSLLPRKHNMLPILAQYTHFVRYCAGWENRTPDQSLENSYFTTKLIPPSLKLWRAGPHLLQLVGLLGIGPSLRVPKTRVLPVYYSPSSLKFRRAGPFNLSFCSIS